MEQKFYRCAICGNMIAMVKIGEVPIICCEEPMQEIIPGTSDAATEKHVPAYRVEGNQVIVTVGAIEHPMAEEHCIEWISLQTKQGNQRKILAVGAAPKAVFWIDPQDEIEAVYAYCNLHGLWRA